MLLFDLLSNVLILDKSKHIMGNVPFARINGLASSLRVVLALVLHRIYQAARRVMKAARSLPEKEQIHTEEKLKKTSTYIPHKYLCGSSVG